MTKHTEEYECTKQIIQCMSGVAQWSPTWCQWPVLSLFPSTPPRDLPAESRGKELSLPLLGSTQHCVLCPRMVRRVKNPTFPLSVHPTVNFSWGNFDKSKQTEQNKIQSILIICGFHVCKFASVVWIIGPSEFLAQMSTACFQNLHATLLWHHPAARG